jgi:alkylation response protein AidB-like acyl-CoA dehydrogenase
VIERTHPAVPAYERACAVAPVLRANAEETESLGTLAPGSVGALVEARLFSVMVPAELAGLGADLVTAMEVIELLSRADGSSGWTLMANCLSTSIAAAYCGDAAVATMFTSDTPAIVAGMLGPGGGCVAVAGGYRGSGKYSFGSGAAHADWLAAGMLVTENGKPRMLAAGQPEVRVCIVRRSAAALAGNWNVMGLVGTGSYDYLVPEQFIPGDYTFERTSLEPCRGSPIFKLGVAGLACAGHAAVALGIAARALEEIAALAPSKKRPAYPSTIGEHALFVHDFAHQEAAYQAARAYAYQLFGEAQSTVMSGRELSGVQRHRFRQCVTYVHTVAAEVVRRCYTWGGSDALRLPSPLGRCLRDISGATQHVFVDPINLVDAGPALIEAWRSAP